MRKPRLSMLLCTVALVCGACGTEPDPPSAPPSSPIEVDDAVILTLRAQTDIALDLRRVEEFRRLLRIARAAVPPQVAAIHSIADSDYSKVALNATGTIAIAFDQGRLRTGNDALDALFARFGLSSARVGEWSPRQDPSSGQFNLYWLTFKGPIQTALLARAIQDLHIAEIKYAEPNHTIGGGDTIWATRTEAGWTIVFDHGEGDCPAGCIQHTRTRVLVDPDGKAHLLGEENK